jgi:signal transduction histidine kinase/PAS domain-containing protein
MEEQKIIRSAGLEADSNAEENPLLAKHAPGGPPVHIGQGLLRQLLDTLPLGVAFVDRKGDVLLANPAATRIWGRVIESGEERYDKSGGFWHDTGTPIAREEWPSMRALTRGEAGLGDVIDIEAFDGSRKTISSAAIPIRDHDQRIVGAVIVNEDVTARVRSEDALRKTQRLLVEAAELGHTGSWEHDLVTGEIVQTEENRRLFFGEEHSKGAVFEDYASVMHPDDRERGIRRHEELVAGTAGRDFEFRVIWPDGSIHVLYCLTTVVRDAAGRPIRIYGTNVDVTERRRAEEQLARQARQQAAIAQISLSALGAGEIQTLLEEAVALVARTLAIEYGLVAEHLPKDGAVLVRAAAGPWKDSVTGKRLDLLPGFTTWSSIRADLPIVVHDLPSDHRLAPCELLLEHAVKSGINVPILGHERPFGLLGAHTTRTRSFAPDEVNFVWSVANVLAAAIEQKQSAAELRDQRERLQALSRRLLDAQEVERRAIARELHDDFGAMLSAIKLNLQKKDWTAGETRSETLGLVDQAIQQIRDLAVDLRPSILDDLGLAQALRWYAAREARRAGVELTLEIDDIAGQLSPQVETAAFRLVQEALTNVVRHSGAQRVEVALVATATEVRVEVRDDGKGFQVSAARDAAAAGRSQGLSNMQERAGLAGGALEIESAPGHGTTIRASFPIYSEGRLP